MLLLSRAAASSYAAIIAGKSSALAVNGRVAPSTSGNAAKTAQIQRLEPEDKPELNDEVDSFYAVLAGGGYDSGFVRAEVGGGLARQSAGESLGRVYAAKMGQYASLCCNLRFLWLDVYFKS